MSLLAFKLDGGKLLDITTTTTMIFCARSEVLSFEPHQSFSKNAMQAIVFIYSLALLLACMARAMNLRSMGSLEQGKSSQQRNLICPSAGLCLLQGLPHSPSAGPATAHGPCLQGPRAMIPSPNPLPFCRAGPATAYGTFLLQGPHAMLIPSPYPLPLALALSNWQVTSSLSLGRYFPPSL